ncbi:MAG: glyoxalase [Anaerovoracaceae bacterium]
MRLKNILLVVRDIEKSKHFYQEVFGLLPVRDFGENVILTEGITLQDAKVWQHLIDKKVMFSGNNTALYFEERNFASFLTRLKESSFTIEFLNEAALGQDGKRVVRFYDPDYHIIEVKES